VNDCGDFSDEKEEVCVKDYPERCSFEQNTCSWYQDQNDDIEWTRGHGGAFQTPTSPWVDHTKGNNILTRRKVLTLNYR